MLKLSKKYKQRIKHTIVKFSISITTVLAIALATFGSKNYTSYLSKITSDDSQTTTTISDATLDSVTINGENYAFTSGVYSYDIALAYTTDDMVTISTTKKNDSQTISGLGSFLLDSENKYEDKIVVTSADKTATNTYDLRLTKASSNKLKSLTIAGVALSPEFSTDTTAYTASVSKAVTSLNVSATPYDKNSTTSITGADSIKEGTNTITVKVTNPNISSDTTYTISVTTTKSIDNLYKYTGKVEEYTAQYTGEYKLETWGAQGGTVEGYAGGNGGYSSGSITLTKGQKIYVCVGGAGIGATATGQSLAGGYNGGGSVIGNAGVNHMTASGGGATSITTTNRGILANFNSYRSEVLIVAGGGGGGRNQSNHESAARWGTGGAGGGVTGIGASCNQGTFQANAGTQTSGYAFGQGETANCNGAGGAGYYGGYGGCPSGLFYTGTGSGGSGYIGGVTNGQTIAGNTSVPTYTGTSTMTGNTGAGYAKIECLCQTASTFPVKNIKTSAGTFNRAFTPDNSTYYVQLGKDDYKVNVSLELADSSAVIDSGSEGTITTNVGTTEHKIKVTGSDGTVYEYTIVFVREASAYQYLDAITIGGTTIEGFSPEKLNYSINLPYDNEKITLDAVKARPQQTVEGCGDYETSYNEKMITIKSTSEDGSKSATYSIAVKRGDTTKLKSCEIENQDFASVFKSDTYNYDFEVTSGVINLKITATPYDSDCRVTIKGAGYIKEGKNEVTITVSKEGLSDTVYTIMVTKPESNGTKEYGFSYSGGIQSFTAPATGFYQLETWGAQGGNQTYQGGYGGYSKGNIKLTKGETIYICVGQAGQSASTAGQSLAGGYNGGGSVIGNGGVNHMTASGGGATSITKTNLGVLSNFSNNKEDIIMVAGGGGGARNQANHESAARWGEGGAGGGTSGIGANCNHGTFQVNAGTQTSGYAFGTGESVNGNSAGGGGYYGGFGGNYNSGSYYTGSGSGGSGYISTSLKSAETIAGNASMPTHDGENVMTGNSGNGYAKITLLKDPSQNNLLKELQLSYGGTKHTMEIGTQGVLDKAFSYDDNEYTVTVGSEDTSFTIYGVQDDATATVVGNGTFDIPAGTTQIKLTVTAESEDVRTYTINVKREASKTSKPTNIKIEGLIESLININPEKYGILTNKATGAKTEFDPDVHEYNITVPARLKKLTFDVTKGHKYQVVTGDGEHTLAGGENVIAIKVASEDGTVTETYTYYVNRDMSGNCMLQSMHVTNLTTTNYPTLEKNMDISFDQDTLEYYLIVPNEVDHLDITAIPEVSTLTPKIIGNTNLKVGLNDVYVIINAENGEQLVYIIHCYRSMSGNTFLSDLKVTSTDGNTTYTLKPIFNKILDTYEVTEEVANSISKVNIVATAEKSTTTVTGAGEKNLSTGTNVFTISTKAEDGSIGTYTVSISRKKSDDNYLTALSSAEGSFIDASSTDENATKTFAKDTNEYSMKVGSTVDHLTLSYTKEDSTASVEIIGNSGFKAGDNTVKINVTAENGEVRTYTIIVNKEKSTDDYLNNLWTNCGKLTPNFNKDTTEYSVEVENEQEDITVNATTNDVRSTVSGTGIYALNIGENDILVTVTAESGDTKVYTLKVTRKLNSNKKLTKVIGKYTDSEIKTVEATKNDDSTYQIDVPNATSEINITGIPEIATTVISGNGKQTLTVGENKFKLIATSADSSTKEYTVIVNRAKTSNANLKSLFIHESNYTPNLSDDITTYTTKVLIGVKSLTMDITTQDQGATYTVIGNENLTTGKNEIKIDVTASDGTTKKEYTIITYVQNQNTNSNYLIDLAVSKGTLTPTFNKDTLVYTDELEYEVSSIDVTAIAEDAGATIVGVGTYTLNVGENDIAIKVTSSDGIERTYQIKAIRKQSAEARLSKLEVTNYSFTPTFDKDTDTYYLSTTKDNLDISCTTLDKNATYEIENNANFVKGTNNVIIKVTAPDGTTTKNYTIVVTKTASPNFYLSDLKVVGYSISPEFNKSIANYTTSVPSNVYKVSIVATPEDATSTVAGAGIVSLNPGANVETITVTSESGKIKTYTITINKGLSDDNDLKYLNITKGTLTPTFDKDTLEYTAEVNYEDSIENIVAYANDSRSTITGDGNQSLIVGENKLKVIVKSESGKEKTYTINVTRKPAVSALLENLSAKGHAISPTFDMNTKAYSVTVENEITSLDLTIKTLDPSATYTVIGNSDFKVGINTVTIEVTSSDGITKENYVLNVTRQIESNNYLSYIQPSVGTLNPTFNKKTMEYSIEVESEVSSITINAETEDTKATLTGTGTFSLNKGTNTITLKVTSALGIDRTYTINVIRKKNDDNYLSNLQVKKGTTEMTVSPSFDKNTMAYTVSGIPAGTAVIQVLATPENELATITGSGYISLTAATTTQNITVTAEDGTTRTYTLTLNRDKSSVCNLTDIVPSVGELSPAFSYSTTDYTLAAGNTDDYLSFEVETEDKNSTVTGNENQAVPEGQSTRKIIVTAEDGTTKTYTITVTRVRTDDARLKELTTTTGFIIAPNFNQDTYTYTINVANDVTKFLKTDILTAVPKYDTSKVTLDDDLELSTQKTNVYNIQVLAADGFTTQNYKLNIIRAKNTDPYLSNLEVQSSNGTTKYDLTPTFAKDTMAYNITVTNEDYLTLLATPENSAATVTNAGKVELKEGLNEIKITVTAEDGITIKEYTLNVTSVRTDRARLKNLAIKSYTFDQEFDSEKYEYTLTVPNDKFEITENEIVAKAMYDGSSITYTGTIELSSIALNTYEVTVTSPNGTAKATYTIKITRKKSSDSSLSSLSATGYKLDKTFQSGVTNYIVYVPKGTTTFEKTKVAAVPTDQYATIVMSNDLDRTKGENTFTINVTSQDETTTTTYTLKVEDEKSNDGDLKYLTVTGGTLSPTFEKTTREYTIKMTNKQTKLVIKAEPEDANAVIEEGTGTYTITENSKQILVKIKAEDGSYKIYILNVTKDTSPIATISGKITTENLAGKYTAQITLNKLTEGTTSTGEKTTTKEKISEITTNADGTYKLELEAKTDSDVADDNNNGTIDMLDHKYEIVVKKDGYVSYTITNITIADGDKIDLGTHKILGGDVIATGEIELDDLVNLNDHYGTTNDSNKIYDLNEDGTIDKKDTAILKANYGKSAEVIKK